MGKHNTLYKVVVYTDAKGRDCQTIYETTSRDKAEKYLSQYLKANDNITRAYIESRPMKSESRRDYEDDYEE